MIQMIKYFPFPELIDTLWNVNMGNVVRVKNIIIELIDTLWNVNTIGSIALSSSSIELIDTLWNVN